MADPQTFPLQTIARLLDLTPRRVQQLSNEGIIPKASRGRYELVPAVQGYVKYWRELSLRSDGSGDDYNAHRTRLTKVKADMAEMEHDQMSNSLIPANDVRDAWDTMASNMRARLLGIPTKMAARVFAADDVNDAKKILKESINEALQELAAVEIKTNNPIRAKQSEDDSAEDDAKPSTAARRKNK